MNPTHSVIWQKLSQAQQALCHIPLESLYRENSQRIIQMGDITLDFSKNHLTQETLMLLGELAKGANVTHAFAELNKGHLAGHLVARQPTVDLSSMENVVTHIHQSHITDIVNIGIGGSDLGPHMCCQALTNFKHTTQHIHFVSTLDATQISTLLATLNPKHTLFIISSKSFTTEETLCNAAIAKQWLIQHQCHWQEQIIAITANVKLATEQLGIKKDKILLLPENIGGRYSIWSTIGLPLAILIGMKNFRQFLAGAYAMDQHALTAPLLGNMPLVLALLNIWYVNFWRAQTHAILPYDIRLERLPAYLQQLEMESNGKSVNRQHEPIDYATSPIIWGQAGTNGQHAFYQLLHQGTVLVPADFLVARHAPHAFADQHKRLIANCLAQTQALMQGSITLDAPEKNVSGNHPSTLIMFDELNPFTLGALIALYEHKVFFNATIWNINPFDQWGVELGKKLAREIYLQIENNSIDLTHHR